MSQIDLMALLTDCWEFSRLPVLLFFIDTSEIIDGNDISLFSPLGDCVVKPLLVAASFSVIYYADFAMRISAVTGSSNKSLRRRRVEKNSSSRFSISPVAGLSRAITS